MTAAEPRLPRPVRRVERVDERYGDQEVHQFRGAEMIAEKWDITREDDGGVRARVSHARAAAAMAEGRFDTRDRAARRASRATKGPREHDAREDGRRCRRSSRAAGSPRRVSSPDLRRRRPRCSSPPSRRCSEHGLTPRARIHHMSVRGDDPMLHAHRARSRRRAYALEQDRADASTTSTCSRSTRRSPRSCWPGCKETGADLEQGQRQRRRDRARPSARRDRRPADDHAAPRARAHRRPLRPADDVRGRRPGQRHDHRAPVGRIERKGATRHAEHLHRPHLVPGPRPRPGARRTGRSCSACCRRGTSTR